MVQLQLKDPKLTKEMKFHTFKCLAPFSKGGYDKPKTYEYEGFEVDLNDFKVNL